MIKILLTDDHPVMRDGLRALLETQGDIEVVGEAANGREAVSLARQLHPDVVIMDIAMPDLNGIEATLLLQESCPTAQVLILSMHSTTEHICRALQSGARGYLLKDSAGAEVVSAIRAVHAGRRYLSQKIAASVVDDYIAERHRVSPVECLSGRERQILQLVAEGKSSAEVGTRLFLSPKTVDTYRSRMMHKLGISDLASLIKFAIQNGLIALD
jgi:two-component system, NarL family, response regulator NreC